MRSGDARDTVSSGETFRRSRDLGQLEHRPRFLPGEEEFSTSRLEAEIEQHFVAAP